MTPRLLGSTIHTNIFIILQSLFIMLCWFSESDWLSCSNTSACLQSCHLSTVHTALSPPPITTTSSFTSSYSIQYADSTSVPCALNASNTAVGSTSTSLTCTNSTPPSSTTFDPSEGSYHPHWLSFTSRLPHSPSIPSSPLIMKTQKSSFDPSFALPCSPHTSFTNSILVGNATTPLGLTPSNTILFAKSDTAATTLK